MYLSFYNLSKKPFTISADPRFLWQGEKHKEAFANLKYGLLDLNGYVVLTGDVGTGKTTLVNALIEMLDESVYIANINHPTLETLDFFRLIAKAYDPSAEITNKAEFLLFLHDFLQKSHTEGKVVLLIIDEAHRLSKELLEEIRLFSNIEQAGVKLINIFFVGQIEFKEIIQWPECRALRQRITLFYDLEPLTENETLRYVEHRLKIAGATGQLFTPEAIRRIHKFTKGCPRLINILCDRALLTGYVREQRKIGTSILKECSRDLRFHHLAKTTGSFQGEKRHKLLPVGLAGLVALGLTAAGLSMYFTSSTKYNVSPTPAAVAVEQHVSSSISHNPETSPQYPPNKEHSVSKTDVQEIVKNIPKTPEQETVKKVPDHIEEKPKSPSASKGEVLAKTSTQQPQAKPAQSSEKSQYSVLKADAQKTVTDVSKSPGQETVKEIPAHVEKKPNSPPESQGEVVVKASTKKAQPKPAQSAGNGKKSVSKKQTQSKTFQLATIAIEKEDFLLGIDLLETQGKPDGGGDLPTRKLYAKALVGRAEQVGLSPATEAEALLKMAVKVNPDSIDAHYDLGKIYTQSRKYALAIDSYQNVIKRDPEMADAFFNLGYIYATNNDYENAEKQFLQVVQLVPRYQGKALFNLALIQEKLGKREECLANLHKAVILTPENEKAQYHLKRLLGSMEVNQQ